MGRYDISSKSFAECSPLTLLRRFGHASLRPETRVTPVERELVMSIKTIDQAFLLETGGKRAIEHFEGESVLSGEDLPSICIRAVLLSIKYSAPVQTTIVLMSKRHAPAQLPPVVVEDRGGFTIHSRLRFVKLWEERPAEILSEPDVNALPLVGAMNATREEFVAVIRRLNAVPDPEQRARLLAELGVWSRLNYNEIEIQEIRAEMSMTLKDLMMLVPEGEELAREKWLEGQKEGHREGQREGELAQARRDILRIAGRRFPGLLDASALEAIRDSEKLQALHDALFFAPDQNVFQAAVNRILGEGS